MAQDGARVGQFLFFTRTRAGIMVRAAVQEAQPVSVEDGVITFAVSAIAADSVKPKFQKEAHTIWEGFEAELGATPRFRFTIRDVTAPAAEPEAPRPKRTRPAPEAVAAEPARELEEDVHLDDIVDAPVDAVSDSRARIESMFDATVVEEHEHS